MTKTSKYAVDEILWENYYSIGVSRAGAMANIWCDYENGMMFPWANEEWGITEKELLESIARLTLALIDTDLTEQFSVWRRV
jgi:hypothetical protein